MIITTHHDREDVCDLSSQLKNDDRCGYGMCGSASQSSCPHHCVATGGDQATVDTTGEHQGHELTNETTKASTCTGRQGERENQNLKEKWLTLTHL